MSTLEREQYINSYTHIRGYILRKVELIYTAFSKPPCATMSYDASFYMLFIIILFRGRPLQGEGGRVPIYIVVSEQE